MKKRDAKDLIKLHEILSNPSLEAHYQEVFSFVKAITDKGLNQHDLTAETIEHWNRQFDDVLGQLVLKSNKEGQD
jgi:hypothetical protein